MWHVEILGGGEKNLDRRTYNIPARNCTEAYDWEIKQARNLCIEWPVIQVSDVAEVTAVVEEVKGK